MIFPPFFRAQRILVSSRGERRNGFHLSLTRALFNVKYSRTFRVNTLVYTFRYITLIRFPKRSNVFRRLLKILSFLSRQHLPRCTRVLQISKYILLPAPGINRLASLFIRASLPFSPFLSRRFAPFPRRILSTRHVHTATRPVLSRNSTYEYNDSTPRFSYFPFGDSGLCDLSRA